MQKFILYLGQDPDITHRYQLIVKAFGAIDEICSIRADLCAKGFGIYNINKNTIEAIFFGDDMGCRERLKELDNTGWVSQKYFKK